MTTLTNEFHGTEYRTRYSRDELREMYGRVYTERSTEAERALLRKIRRTLCGVEGCTCGDFVGER